MTDPAPLVSVVIPALNEEADIAGCIEAIGAQDYPLDRIEIIVVDGCSDDRTREVAAAAASELGLAAVSILENPRRRTSTSLNVGLQAAQGDYLVRVDARSRIPSSYVRTCIGLLATDPTVGVVGGAQRPWPRSTGLVDRGIARALDNRLATGLSRYRRSATSGPADTVWMGVFRTAELQALGGWDDSVALNEDFDLNTRFRESGQLVWFAGGLESGYLPRTDFRRLARQYYFFGRVKGTWWLRGTRPTPRQAGLMAVPPLLGLVWWQAIRRLGPVGALLAPAAFVALDVAGGSRSATSGERLVASAAMAVYTAAWWLGVVAGAVGELFGIEHQHGVDV